MSARFTESFPINMGSFIPHVGFISLFMVFMSDGLPTLLTEGTIIQKFEKYFFMLAIIDVENFHFMI